MARYRTLGTTTDEVPAAATDLASSLADRYAEWIERLDDGTDLVDLQRELVAGSPLLDDAVALDEVVAGFCGPVGPGAATPPVTPEGGAPDRPGR